MKGSAKLVKAVEAAAGSAWLVWLAVLAVLSAKGVAPLGDKPICGPECWPMI